MPVYELFCLARPQVSREALASVIKTASNAVFSNSGLMTDISSYGLRDLAYPIRKAGVKYTVCAFFTHLADCGGYVLTSCSVVCAGRDVADELLGGAVCTSADEPQFADRRRRAEMDLRQKAAASSQPQHTYSGQSSRKKLGSARRSSGRSS